MKSMAELLGPEVFTDEFRDAWTAGYNQLAAIMSGREEAIYTEQEKKRGGWRGWRSMKIVKKIKESDDATSFYFKPADGGEIPDFRPGQYVSLSIDVPQLEHKQIRQYSLSDAPPAEDSAVMTSGAQANGIHAPLGRAYRITVKRESGLNIHEPEAEVHPGYISNLLHDTYQEGDVIDMSHPAGEFFLDQDLDDSAPVVLISAGVGLTPLMSMLQTLLKKDNARDRRISWIHVAKNKAIDPFADDIAHITKEHNNVRSKVFHSSPLEKEQLGVDYDLAGRPDLLAFDKETQKDLLLLDDTKARYFICGPNEFMVKSASALKQMGVNAERIKMELFKVGYVGA